MNDKYIMYLKGSKKSERTIDTYCTYINKFLGFINKPETEANMEDLIVYEGSIAHLSNATIALHINSIKSYYKFLKKIGDIEVNPFEEAETPRINNKQKYYMTSDDVRLLIDNGGSAKTKAIIATVASTGLRMSEMASITIKQYEDMKRYGNRNITITGKGDKERTVFINDMAFSYIEAFLEKKGSENKSGLLFEGNRGNIIDDRSLNRAIKLAAKKAGLPYWKEIGCHQLRAAFATIASEKGVPVATISAALGHSSIATTTRYIKNNQDNINNAMNMMQF